MTYRNTVSLTGLLTHGIVCLITLCLLTLLIATYYSYLYSLIIPVAKTEITRAVPDLFFPIRLEQDFAGFGMTNPARARATFSN